MSDIFDEGYKDYYIGMNWDEGPYNPRLKGSTIEDWELYWEWLEGWEKAESESE